jgi:hypothetical protein
MRAWRLGSRLARATNHRLVILRGFQPRKKPGSDMKCPSESLGGKSSAPRWRLGDVAPLWCTSPRRVKLGRQSALGLAPPRLLLGFGRCSNRGFSRDRGCARGSNQLQKPQGIMRPQCSGEQPARQRGLAHALCEHMMIGGGDRFGDRHGQSRFASLASAG